MKALFYADWCTIRSTFVRTLLICGLVAIPLTVATYEGGGDAPGIFVASIITVMPLFYFMLGLFGGDEQQGWEETRLALPITTGIVVRARYAFLALSGLCVAVAGSVLGIVTNLAFSAFGNLTAPPSALEAMAAAFGSAAFALAYLALLMPMSFKIGIAKSRVYFTIPFMLPLLLNVGPVRDFFTSLVGRLDAISTALGSPAPLIGAGVCVCALIYLVSMRISELVYASRDF